MRGECLINLGPLNFEFFTDNLEYARYRLEDGTIVEVAVDAVKNDTPTEVEVLKAFSTARVEIPVGDEQ